MRKAVLTAIIVLFVVLLGAALAAAYFYNKNQHTVSLYFKNAAGNCLEAEERSIDVTDNTSDDEIFNLVLSSLKAGPKANSALVSTFGNVDIVSSSYDKSTGTAYVDLSSDYYMLDIRNRILLKTSIVYTLTALAFINDAVISVEGDKEEAEVLNRKNVVLNPDVPAEKINYRTVTLYFTDSKGEKLYGEERLLEIRDNKNAEYQVVEELLGGPDSSRLTSAIPSGVKLIQTNTENGICYVNFSSAFINKTDGNTLSAVQVYSVVNSLTELEEVNSVQIYVEGQKVNQNGGDIDISKVLERNEKIIGD